MANVTEKDEELHLRKRIQYLTDLINNARCQPQVNKNSASFQRNNQTVQSTTAQYRKRNDSLDSFKPTGSRTELNKAQFVWKKNSASSGTAESKSRTKGSRYVPLSRSNLESDLPLSRSSSVPPPSSVQENQNLQNSSKFRLQKNVTFPQKTSSNISRISVTSQTEGYKHVNLTACNTKYKLVKETIPKSVVVMTTAHMTSSSQKVDLNAAGNEWKESHSDNSIKNISERQNVKSSSEINKSSSVSSPSKKETVEQLNKKLSVASDKIKQIKRNFTQTFNEKTDKNSSIPCDKASDLVFKSQAGSNPLEMSSTSKTAVQSSKSKSRFKFQRSSTDQRNNGNKLKSPTISCYKPGSSTSGINYKSRFKFQKMNMDQNTSGKNLELSPLCQSGYNMPTSSQAQIAANVIRSKYKLRKHNVFDNKSPVGVNVNLDLFYHKMAKKYGWTLERNKLNVNMKSFYHKMAKKYGWTNYDLKKSGYNVKTNYPKRRESWRRQRNQKLEKRQKGNKFSLNRKNTHNIRLPHASRLKLDRRKVSPKPLVNRTSKGTHFVLLNGVLYNANRTSMVKSATFRANTFAGQRSFIRSKVRESNLVRNQKERRDTMKYSLNARIVASKAVNRSIVMATAKYRKDNTKQKTKQYCTFYNRFGKCNRGDNCPYTHDPERVAVCTRFLRGTCKIVDCSFSHKVSKEKMPVCSYFLKGVCNREECPYLHVNVSRDAAICQDFLNGYCPLGEQCKKKHTRGICPEFAALGKCSKKDKCQLIHVRKEKKVRKRSTPATAILGAENEIRTPQTSSSLKRRILSQEVDNDDPRIPFKHRRLPTFISLDSNPGGSKANNLDNLVHNSEKVTNVGTLPLPENSTKSIRIKPQL